MGGKHIIEAPANSSSLCFNYKRSFSVVLLALVDANYRLISLRVGSYGMKSNKVIFTSSNKYGKSTVAEMFKYTS
nr:unnamed protein product [Callosobruchus chinensis]